MRVATAVSLLAAAVVATAGMASVAAAGGAAAAPEVAPVCPGPVGPGIARCSAIQLLNPALNWHGVHVLAPAKGPGNGHGRGGGGGGGTTTTPSGYDPTDLQTAYGLTSISGSQGAVHTVAIVDAYNDPYAASDLAVYRKEWGLPALCGTVSGGSCVGSFKQVNQYGVQGSYPRGNKSWSEEISLDLDMVSAICPYCNIILVEAKSATFTDLTAAEATALSYSPNAVSNSYGASEFSGETAYNQAYSSTYSAITVSAGDGGYGVEYPAAAPTVVAVGGTTLSDPSDPSSQTVWSGTGSGCSAYEPMPSWQPQTTFCSSGRTVADVSADANPSTGVAVYDTYGESGWLVFGGTSVASPIVASVFALAGYHGSSSHAAQGLYNTSAGSLTQISQGSNGSCGDYLCNAAYSLGSASSDPGYNGPTGNGTPNGLNRF